MTNTNSTNRKTVAGAYDEIASVREAIENLTKLFTAQFASPARVVEITSAPSVRTNEIDDEQRYSEPSHAGKTTRNSRKSTSKAKTTKSVEVLTIEQAQAVVDGGASPWSVKVASSKTGEPIPYGKVLQAMRAATRSSEAKVEAPVAKPTSADMKAKALFGMGGKELLALGTKDALAEIARREANRARKAAEANA